MFSLRNITSGLRSLFQKKEVERELDEELRTYLEMAIDEKMKLGMSREDAARAVRLQHGRLGVAKVTVRAAGWESLVGAGWRTNHGCNLCRPKQNAAKQILGYQHSFVMISVVGTGLSLPCDGEPYGPGDSEYAAGQRLLRRVVASVGKRFAQYVVVDGEFATAPFLHTAGELGLRVVARLKDNLPELLAATQKRFPAGPPATVFQYGADRVELWDAEDFDPWNTLRWETVRVFFYRQHKPDGRVVEAYWLTNFPYSTVGPQALFRMAKSRWEIENQGFNDAKSRHGLEHICHHHANSLLIGWLLTMLALTIERL